MARFHALEFSSSEILYISNPFSWYLLYNFFKPGIARRQGPHQLAQKSIRTYLLSLITVERKILSPLVFGKRISGAFCPSCIDCATENWLIVKNEHTTITNRSKLSIPILLNT